MSGVSCVARGRYDLVGVGIGPFNLSLAALAAPLLENHSLSALFLDEKPAFSWHPGMMIEGARLQVPFLADLVSLTDPTSRFSALNWLWETERLYGFYFAENFFLERREYEAYCAWAASLLTCCCFGSRVTSVCLSPEGDEFDVSFTTPAGTESTVRAANVALGIGSAPTIPEPLQLLARDGAVCHSADYLANADGLRAMSDVTVVGSGQSGAEVFLDLLRNGAPEQRLRWLTRTIAFEPMEYSKLGLEHFTPDYTRYFHSLDADARADLLRVQGRLHKAISAETIADIHAELHARSFGGGTGATLMPDVTVTGGSRSDDGTLTLECRHSRQRQDFSVHTRGLVLATGYREREPECLKPISSLMERDAEGRMAVGIDYRVPLEGSEAGLYVQNAELHTHGVGAPDLGLGAHRAGTIVNAVAGRTIYRLPGRVAHTSFGPAAASVSDPGIVPAASDFPRPRSTPAIGMSIGIEEATDATIVTYRQG